MDNSSFLHRVIRVDLLVILVLLLGNSCGQISLGDPKDTESPLTSKSKISKFIYSQQQEDPFNLLSEEELQKVLNCFFF
jgi:hypothetical protein